MRTVLITGAAGFLGQHIGNHFGAEGWKILATDKEFPKYIKFSGWELFPLALPSRELEGILTEKKPDVLVHCAGKSSVAESIQNPKADYDSQVGVTQALLQAVENKINLKRFVYLSSAAVYGNPPTLPVDENSALAPISPYGKHKSLAEALCREAFTRRRIPTVIARIFSAYGPGLKRQVIWETCRQAVCKQNIVLEGTGKETRDFIHAADVAQAIYLLSTKSETVGKNFNIALGLENSIEKMANLVRKKCRRDSAKFMGRQRPGDPERWVANIESLKALGFSAKFDLEAGLENTLAWVREIPCD